MRKYQIPTVQMCHEPLNRNGRIILRYIQFSSTSVVLSSLAVQVGSVQMYRVKNLTHYSKHCFGY